MLSAGGNSLIRSSFCSFQDVSRAGKALAPFLHSHLPSVFFPLSILLCSLSPIFCASVTFCSFFPPFLSILLVGPPSLLESRHPSHPGAPGPHQRELLEPGPPRRAGTAAFPDCKSIIKRFPICPHRGGDKEARKRRAAKGQRTNPLFREMFVGHPRPCWEREMGRTGLDSLLARLLFAPTHRVSSKSARPTSVVP